MDSTLSIESIENNVQQKRFVTGRSTLLSIIVPLFNEERNINALYERLRKTANMIYPYNVEFILVDDGSKDNTFAVATEICYKHGNTYVLKLAKNFGSHAAIMAGLAESHGDCALFLAGDLQDPPELMAQMLELWQRGYKIIWAARTHIEGQKLKDRLFSSLFWMLTNWVTTQKFPISGVDFFLVDKRVVEIIRRQKNSRLPVFIQVAATGFESVIVRYVKALRPSGKSGWTLRKKLGLVFETILSSTKAIRLLGMVVVLLTLLAFSSGMFSVVAGSTWFSVTLSMISLLIASVAAMLWLSTEYISARLFEARNVPRYIVADKVDANV